MEKKKRLIIIDSNALLYRSFYALPPLTTKSGQATGAVYGFLLTLFKAITDLGAGYVVACFDTKGKTFRHEKFEEYKAQRALCPKELISQIPIVKEVLSVLNIPIFEKEGVEADDLIATICKKVDRRVEVFIVSGDLDNTQLVNENIKVYTLGRGIKETIIYDMNKVKERFGVSPNQIVDFKALAGDLSDNIPGVSGIGKKTAAEILQRYGSVEGLYKELSTDTAVLKPKIKETLRKNKAIVLMSQELAKMKDDVDISFEIERCKFGGFNVALAKELFKKLEFHSLISRIEKLYNNKRD